MVGRSVVLLRESRENATFLASLRNVQSRADPYTVGGYTDDHTFKLKQWPRRALEVLALLSRDPGSPGMPNSNSDMARKLFTSFTGLREPNPENVS